MAGYQKNQWTVYNETVPDIEQPDSFITKKKLDHMENGIVKAITDLQIGSVTKGTDAYCEIVPDENDHSIKRINLVIPREVSWLFSESELNENDIAPTGVFINDMILDVKGNIFSIISDTDGINRLKKRININGEPGSTGPVGPPGPGGKDANKWIYVDNSLSDGQLAPENILSGDFIIDNEGKLFSVSEDLAIHYLITIKGQDAYLSMGNVSVGDTAFAEITSDQKLNLIIPRGPMGNQGPQGIQGEKGEVGPQGETGPQGRSVYDIWLEAGNNGSEEDLLKSFKGEKGDPGPQGEVGPQGEIGPVGPAGESTYDIWKALGNTGDANDFLYSIRGEQGPAVPVIDSLDSTSTTEALSANQGNILKNNRLVTLEDILNNETEGIFVDALAVKELYLKMQELIESIK